LKFGSRKSVIQDLNCLINLVQMLALFCVGIHNVNVGLDYNSGLFSTYRVRCVERAKESLRASGPEEPHFTTLVGSLFAIDLLGRSIKGNVQIPRPTFGVTRLIPQYLIPNGNSGGRD
jgi:hypothetical protein